MGLFNRIQCIAATWRVFDHRGRHERLQYSRIAFSDWLATLKPRGTWLMFNHETRIPTIHGTARFRATGRGLEAEFEIDRSNPFGNGAWLAVRCGFVRSVSLGASAHAINEIRDDIGRVRRIVDASVTEVSLTDDPADGAAKVWLAGGEPMTNIERPKSDDDAKCLAEFLATVGITTPIPPKPVPHSPSCYCEECHRKWITGAAG